MTTATVTTKQIRAEFIKKGLREESDNVQVELRLHFPMNGWGSILDEYLGGYEVLGHRILRHTGTGVTETKTRYVSALFEAPSWREAMRSARAAARAEIARIEAHKAAREAILAGEDGDDESPPSATTIALEALTSAIRSLLG